jgi:hypothetical protein
VVFRGAVQVRVADESVMAVTCTPIGAIQVGIGSGSSQPILVKRVNNSRQSDASEVKIEKNFFILTACFEKMK